jgi:thiol-disulfide isomerase/thioredoxin
MVEKSEFLILKIMKTFSNLCLFFIIFSTFNCSIIAQKQFSVEIQFLPTINLKNIGLYVDNGKENTKITPDFQQNKMKISGDYFSKFATLVVTYSGKNRKPFYIDKFWLSDKPAKIAFIESDTTQNFLEENKCKFAYELKKMGEEEFNSFIDNEKRDLDLFLKDNQDLSKDSISKIFMNKAQNLTEKKVSFIRKNPKLYYSLYVLRGLASYNFANPDSLKVIFTSIFKGKEEYDFENNEIERILNGRLLMKGAKSPNFITKDVTGKVISLNNYQNRNVLLVFWASWCGPCVAEIPTIKQISKRYSEDKLAIIFVTLDNDSTKFSGAVKKYQLDWVQIFGDNDLINKFGVSKIPQVYLINGAGNIIYTREQEKDGDLVFLEKLLAEKL